MKLKEALIVARTDYNISTFEAVKELEKMKYDCGYFWGVIKEVYDKNDMPDPYLVRRCVAMIEARDELYRQLKIDKVMRKAYKIVWDE